MNTETLDSREVPWRELGGMILLTAITIIIVIGSGSGEGTTSGAEGSEPQAEAPTTAPEQPTKAKPEADPEAKYWKYGSPNGDTSGQYRH